MPTPGEYKGKPSSPDSVKKRLDFQGVPVHIDRPEGFKMRGTDAKGHAWERVYKFDYGFIPGTKGGDGEGIDVFIGPESKADEAFWISKTKDGGSFDEYKVFLGFPDRNSAISAFVQHIPQKMMASVVTMKIDMMKAMLGLSPMPEFSKTAFMDELLTLKELFHETSRRIMEKQL